MPRYVPKSQKTGASRRQDDELRFLPDSPEVLADTINCTGCRDKLESVFRQAIKRVKGAK